MALPVSVMLSSMLTFGTLGEHFELTAMKSAGISLYRIMSPLMIVSFLLTLLAFYFANNVLPYSNLKLYTLIFNVRQKHPALSIDEGIFNYDVEDYVIRVSKKNIKTGMMYDFLIYDHKNYYGNRFVLTADSGKIYVSSDFKYLVLELYSGIQYEEGKDNSTNFETREFPHHQDFFDKERIIIPLSGFNLSQGEYSKLFKNNYKMLNVSALKHRIDSLKKIYARKKLYYSRLLLLNDLLKNQIKLRTVTDSANYEDKIAVLNRIPPDSLKVIFDLDSAFKSMSLHDKKQVLKASLAFVDQILTRARIYKEESKSRQAFLVEHWIEFYKKFVYALACLIFFFIGAPLGAIIRHSGYGVSAIVSTLLFLFFYIISMLGERFAKEGVMPVWLALWLAPIIFVPIEAFIFYKALTDSVILNYDVYIEAFNKFIKRITPKFLTQEYKRLKRIKKFSNGQKT